MESDSPIFTCDNCCEVTMLLVNKREALTALMGTLPSEAAMSDKTIMRKLFKNIRLDFLMSIRHLVEFSVIEKGDAKMPIINNYGVKAVIPWFLSKFISGVAYLPFEVAREMNIPLDSNTVRMTDIAVVSDRRVDVTRKYMDVLVLDLYIYVHRLVSGGDLYPIPTTALIDALRNIENVSAPTKFHIETIIYLRQALKAYEHNM